ASTAAAMHFAILNSGGHQWHSESSILGCGGGGGYRCLDWLRLLLLGVAFANPALHAKFAIDSAGLGKAVINIRAQRVQGHAAFMVHFNAGQFGAAETTGAADFDPIGAKIHGRLNRFLHGAAEGNAALELDGNIFSDQLRVEFGGLDFKNIDVD